ncbi:unnamed protein product, partial [Arabidopsis halleri]
MNLDHSSIQSCGFTTKEAAEPLKLTKTICQTKVSSRYLSV